MISTSENDIRYLSNTNKHYYPVFLKRNGGGERARTDGLLRARQALSQLSYTPETKEPLPEFDWWAWMELNHRPHAYQACALTKLSYRPNELK